MQPPTVRPEQGQSGQELSLAGLVAFVVELGAKDMDHRLVQGLESVLASANRETDASGPVWFESQEATDAVATLVAR
jgi:hypothetical protein